MKTRESRDQERKSEVCNNLRVEVVLLDHGWGRVGGDSEGGA